MNKELVDFFCTYTLMNDQKGKEEFKTEAKVPENGKVEFNYRKHHFFTTVDDQILNYLLTSNLKFEIFGNEARKPISAKKLADRRAEASQPKPMTLSETKPGQQGAKIVQTHAQVPAQPTNGANVTPFNPQVPPKPKSGQTAPVADQPPKAKKGSTSTTQNKDKDCNLI